MKTHEHNRGAVINSSGYGCIYCITNTVNGMKYIGQTQKEYINNRFSEHKWIAKSNRSNMILHKAMREFGIKNFDFKILDENIPIQELNNKEIEYIKKLHTFAPSRYNATLGGSGTLGLESWDKGIKRSKETRKKISEAYTDERKEKMRNRMTGENNPQYGKRGVLSAAYGLRRYGEENPFYNKHHSAETREKLSKYRNKDKKAVVMCDVNTGEYIIEFESLSSAAAYIKENTKYKKADDSAIGKCAKGIYKKTYGYKWMFKED